MCFYNIPYIRGIAATHGNDYWCFVLLAKLKNHGISLLAAFHANLELAKLISGKNINS